MKRTTKRTSATRPAAAVETLLERGIALQRQAAAAAQARAREAIDAVAARAGEARTRTAAGVTQLEKAFESRIATAIKRLGIPGNREVRALARQVAQLQKSVEQLRRQRARARAA